MSLGGPDNSSQPDPGQELLEVHADGQSFATSTIASVHREYATDPRLLILLLNDEKGDFEILEGGLGLATSGAQWFRATRAPSAYAALLHDEFIFDAVLVDWRLDHWSPLGADNRAVLGVPDRLPDGCASLGTLEPIASSAAHRDSWERGGHAETLVSLASARGAVVLATSKYTGKNEEAVTRLRLRGARQFLRTNRDFAIPSKGGRAVTEARALLLAAGGIRRDLRIWSGLSGDDVERLQGQIEALGVEGLRDLLERFERLTSEMRHRAALESESEPSLRMEYLLASLSWMKVPRQVLAGRLIDASLTALIESRRSKKAGNYVRLAEALQPSLSFLGGAQKASRWAPTKRNARSFLRRVIDESRSASRELELDADDHLHIFVAPGLRFSSFFASRGESDSRAIEYLGTTFAPRLAADPDERGIWPTTKLSKTRHLLKSSRRRRLFHQAGAVVRGAEGVFGPTIDSFLLADVLVEYLTWRRRRGRPVISCAELGTGTGFLSCIVASQRMPAGASLVASDISDLAVACARWNLSRTLEKSGGETPSVHVVNSADVLSTLRDSHCDLIVSNPPYLPEPSTASDETADATSIAGAQVINLLLGSESARVLRPDGVVLMVTSDRSENIIQHAFEEAKASGLGWQWIKKVRRLSRVPLDLPEVQQDSAWVRSLTGSGVPRHGLDLGAPRFPLRHDVVVDAFLLNKKEASRLAAFFGREVTA